MTGKYFKMQNNFFKLNKKLFFSFVVELKTIKEKLQETSQY